MKKSQPSTILLWEGHLFVLSNDDWKSENEFDSLEAAKAFVNNVVTILLNDETDRAERRGIPEQSARVT